MDGELLRNQNKFARGLALLKQRMDYPCIGQWVLSDFDFDAFVGDEIEKLSECAGACCMLVTCDLAPWYVIEPDVFECLRESVVDYFPLSVARTFGIDKLISVAFILENLCQPGVGEDPIAAAFRG